MFRVSLAEVAPAPWKNGGGETRQLWAWPSAVDWQVRISVAQIAKGGPFSAFPHVQRWFAVLTGAGVRLQFPAGGQHMVPGGPALNFDGGDAPHCELVDGVTTDLNLMVRMEAGQGILERADPEVPWQSPAQVRGIYTVEAGRLQVGEGELIELAANSLLISDSAANQSWQLREHGCAYWLAFQPK